MISAPRSPPSASTATRIMGRVLRSLKPEGLDVAPAVRLAVRAHPVRQLRLPAVRADLEPRRGDRMLRAALVAPRLRGLSLRDGHGRLGTIAGRGDLPVGRLARSRRWSS